MTQPKSYKDLIYEVEKGLDPAPPEAERLAEALVAIVSSYGFRISLVLT